MWLLGTRVVLEHQAGGRCNTEQAPAAISQGSHSAHDAVTDAEAR